jgi:hypothetical protein
VIITDVTKNADYLLRMNDTANDAHKEIADKLPIKDNYDIMQVADGTGHNTYALPTYLKELRYISLLKDTGEYIQKFYDYIKQDNKIKIPKQYGGTFTVYYYKKPTEITKDTSDDFEFEVDEPEAIPYYMAGMVKADEIDPNLSNKMLNMYYDKLGKLKRNDDDYPQQIINVYGW